MEQRVIKFRGKGRPTGDWVYGMPVEVAGGLLAIIRNECETQFLDDRATATIKTDEYAIIHQDTLCQFTGLHDKNGKEIYEGDLLRFPPKDDWEKKSYAVYEVFWHDNDCCDSHVGWQMNRAYYKGNIAGGSVYRFIPENTKKMVVIGNVVDNKDLIEK